MPRDPAKVTPEAAETIRLPTSTDEASDQARAAVHDPAPAAPARPSLSGLTPKWVVSSFRALRELWDRAPPKARPVVTWLDPHCERLCVPEVVALDGIKDPLDRNQAITDSYHQFDAALTAYLGLPVLANWGTFGQHASRQVGAQIRDLHFGMDPIHNLASQEGDWHQRIDHVHLIVDELFHLPQMGQMFAPLLELSLRKAGLQETNLSAVLDPQKFFSATARLHVAKAVMQFPAELLEALHDLVATCQRLRDNLILTNQRIYDNIAPAYRTFLQATQDHPGEVPMGLTMPKDPKGFMSAAFDAYAQAKVVGDLLRVDSPPGCLQGLSLLRAALMHKGNLLLGCQEQLLVVQPIFDTMEEELSALASTLTLRDPVREFKLLPNGGRWGRFYDRMGIDRERSPKDPLTITPQTLPPLLASSCPQFQGTIGLYFEQGLYDQRLHLCPPELDRL